jgi:group II intron reverse transcriptase/maturase
VDGVTWFDYGEGLSERLVKLHERLRKMDYSVQPVRRKNIPKPDGKMRPLGIPALEDKIVQSAVARILSSIYEQDFLDQSVGYRPGRGAREASQKLQHELYNSRVSWVVEADIKGFFDHVDHDWLVKMLEERCADKSFVRLIRKMLNAGVLEEDGQLRATDAGTPQGGLISPVLANIYLHYVLDLWVERVVRKGNRGQMVFLRYADDFVIGFEHEEDAKACFTKLPERLAKFSLILAPDKSGIRCFERRDKGQNERFTFLGFDFYWSRTRSGKPTLRRRTTGKKFTGALTNLKEWLQKNRHERVSSIAAGIRKRLLGHFNYYGVIGNATRLGAFWIAVQRVWFQQLNRRSQRRSYNWTGFNQMWKNLGMPEPRVVERPYVPPGSEPCFNY